MDTHLKIHAVVDGLENPVHFIFTGGKVYDSKQAIPLLFGLNICNSNILADCDYGTKYIHNYIDSQGANYTISPKQMQNNHEIAIN